MTIVFLKNLNINKMCELEIENAQTPKYFSYEQL